jgi:type I restriction enzyme M protein
VSLEEIEKNNFDLSINRYKEVVYEQTEYEKPDEIILQIELLDSKRHSLMRELKTALSLNHAEKTVTR